MHKATRCTESLDNTCLFLIVSGNEGANVESCFRGAQKRIMHRECRESGLPFSEVEDSGSLPESDLKV